MSNSTLKIPNAFRKIVSFFIMFAFLLTGFAPASTQVASASHTIESTAISGATVTATPNTGTLTDGQTLQVDVTLPAAVDPTDATPFSSPSCLVNGVNVESTFTNLTSGSDGHFRFTYTVGASDADRTAGNVPIDCNIQQSHTVHVSAFTDSNTVAINSSGEAEADTTPPTVTSTNPANGATNVALNSTVQVTFSEPMDQSTINSSTFLVSAGSLEAGSITFSGNTAIFTPSSLLAADREYTGVIEIGAKDTADNAIAERYSWTFTTTSESSSSNTGPGNNAVIVGSGTSINFPTSAVPSSGTLAVGQTLEVHFNDSTATEATTASSTSCLVNNVNVAGTLTKIGTGHWKVTYTVGSGDTSRTAGNVPIDCTIIGDQSGTQIQITRFNDSNTVAIDVSGSSSATQPNLSGVSINPGSGTIQTGDTVTVTFTENAGQTDLALTGTCKINGINVAGSFQNLNNGTYTVTYTVGASDGERPAGHIPVTCTLGNSAGNATASAWLDGNTLAIDTNNDGVIDNGTNNLGFTVSASPSSGTLSAGAQLVVSMQDPLPSGDVTIVPEGQTGAGSVTASNGCKVNGVDVSGSYAYHGNGLYKVTYTVGSSDANHAAGEIPFDCTLSNHTGTVHLVAFTDSNTVAIDVSGSSDTTAPTVSSVSPANGATNVAVGSNIQVTFSEPMNQSSINSSTFSVSAGALISGSITYSGNTATFAPSSALDADRQHTVVITTGAEDAAGNNLGQQYSWSFTTAAENNNPAPTLQSIAVTTPATKLTYTVGESLNIAGLVVTGTYSDGSTQVQSISTSNVTGFDSSSPANNQLLTITVNGKTTTYSVTIAAAQSGDKALTAFNIGSNIGVIDENNHTVAIDVPFGTSVTAIAPTFTTTGASVSVNGTTQVSSTTTQNFSSPVTYTVTAQNGTTVDYVVTVNVLPQGTTSTNLTNSSSSVSITSSTTPVNIVIASGTTNPTINLSSLITAGTGTLPAISIVAGNASNVEIDIPAGTVITSSDLSWNEILNAPTATTVTLPTISGQTLSLNTAIEVGFSGLLTFDKAARILIPNQAGKRAGYVRPGISFTEITTTCSADNQTTANSMAAGADCRMDVGADLVIWTKHFTTFAAYTQSTAGGSLSGGAVSGGGGGGGGGAVLGVFTSIPNQRVILGCDIRTVGFSTVTGEPCALNIANALTSPVNLSVLAGSNTNITGGGQVLGATSFRFTQTLRRGSQGEEVIQLQNFLNKLGYNLVVDGKFGTKTRAAVMAFQSANSLRADGVVGPVTRAALNLDTSNS